MGLAPLPWTAIAAPTASTSGGAGIYIWFDLGNVLIDTRHEPFRMMPGAATYLDALAARGYKLGLISNIPATWGKPGQYASKLEALEHFVARHWVDPAHPFAWSRFSRILVPLRGVDRKPSPELFRKAAALARALGYRSLYLGEDRSEIEAARHSRMAAYWVQPGRPYLEVGRIPGYVHHARLSATVMRR